MRNLIIFCISIIILFVACESKKATEPDPPEIYITSPIACSIVGGVILIQTEILNINELTEVSFFCNGSFIGQTYQAPFELEWDTRPINDGLYNLTCKIETEDGVSYSPEVQIQIQNTIFTVTITEEFVANRTAFILLTELDGEIIDYQEFTDPQTFSFNNNGNFDINERICITYGRVSTSSYHSCSITTYNYIPLGRHWILDFLSKGLNYYSALSFSNIPENQDYIISTCPGVAVDTNPLTQNVEVNIFSNQDYQQLYVGLNCNSTYKYKWWESCPEIPVDLSNMAEAETAIVNFSEYGTWGQFKLRGYFDTSDIFSSLYLTLGDLEQGMTSFDLNYPLDKFEIYNTRLYQYDEEENLYYYSCYGDIPESFDFQESDFDFTNIGSSDFSISANGRFDEIYSVWLTESGYWYQYGPDFQNNQSLPEFPDELLDLLYLNNMTVWELQSVTLCDMGAIESYDEIWETLLEQEISFAMFVELYERRTKMNPNRIGKYNDLIPVGPQEY